MVFATLLLSGCGDSPVTMYQMCEEQPNICSDIASEGWCKHKRAELIGRRYQSIITPKDQDNQYRTLVAWRDFNQCINVASKIMRTTVSDRTSTKTLAYLTSLKEIDKLEQATRNSKYPQLLYYHWVQDGSRQKINQLVKLDRANKLATTELQLMMASYYSKVDTTKEIKAQYKALKLLTPASAPMIDNQLYASLATNFLRQKKYRQAYIWTKISEFSGLKTASSSMLKRQLTDREIDLDKMATIAQTTYASIESHSFISPESQY